MYSPDMTVPQSVPTTLIPQPIQGLGWKKTKQTKKPQVVWIITTHKDLITDN